jgi:threonine/homoserine/homoserine lactone efflux protein
MKYKSENLLPNTGRAYRLSYAAGYFAIALIYKKIMSDELAAEKQALMSFTGVETENDAKKHRINKARGTFC